MSSVEQTRTKGIRLKFPPMTSVLSADKSSLLETPLATITGHVLVQNTVAPMMYRVPVSNIAVNQQQAEITQITPEPLSATPTLQETLNKMMSKMTQMEHTMSKMQEHVPVLNLQYFQLPNLPANPAIPPEAQAIPNSVHFEQDQICLHPRELLSEHVGDLDNQENFYPSSCQVVTELNGDSDRQQKFLNFLIKAWCHRHIRVRKDHQLRIMF